MIISSINGMKYNISDVDWFRASEYEWSAIRYGNKYYLRADINGKRIYMHRFILGVSDSKVTIDHKDGDGLNNQRDNLRIATRSQNGANRSGEGRGASKFIGVFWNKKKRYWYAQIKCNYKRIYIGSAKTENEAANLYNKKAAELFGEFATINKIA